MFSISILFRSSYFQRWGHPVFAWEITDISVRGGGGKVFIDIQALNKNA